MRKLVCRCGSEFETKHSHKSYCTSECQCKFSKLDYGIKIKLDYKSRCYRLYNMAKNRAKYSNLAFDLDVEYLRSLWELQEGKCSLSGRLFELERPGENETVKANAPSLDRIIPNKGYVKGNVRLVCYQVNTALNEYGDEALISLCIDILENNGWDCR